MRAIMPISTRYSETAVRAFVTAFVHVLTPNNSRTRCAMSSSVTALANRALITASMTGPYDVPFRYDGCKSVRLARKARRENKLPPLTSPKPLFRRKQDGRQPALHSFQKLNTKGKTFDIGACKIPLRDSFPGQVRSFQIVETTKKITKRTKPEHRTYEIHVQYHHEPAKFHEGDAKGIDLNARNMWGTATFDNGSQQITKLPHGAKHRKYDKDSKMQSRQNKVKKNGRTYKDLQRRRRAKNEKIANKRKDFVGKSLAVQLRDMAVVIIEGLKISSMTKKGPGKRGLNRVMYHSAMGYVKDMILQFCEKHAIAVVIVPARGTSITCAVCGHEDKESRNGTKFACTGCGHENHADLNSPENLVHRTISGVAGNVVCKQKDAMGRIHLKVKKFQKERTNPGRSRSSLALWCILDTTAECLKRICRASCHCC